MFSIFGQLTGMDPGFLIGGGANHPGRGPNIQICQIFPKKMHEIKKILVCRRGTCWGHPPLDWPLVKAVKFCVAYSKLPVFYGVEVEYSTWN